MSLTRVSTVLVRIGAVIGAVVAAVGVQAAGTIAAHLIHDRVPYSVENVLSYLPISASLAIGLAILVRYFRIYALIVGPLFVALMWAPLRDVAFVAIGYAFDKWP